MIEVNNSLHEAAIVVLFGPTGSGKTTFANVASGDSMRIGHGLKSCTQSVEPTTMFMVDGKPVVVVDCPGFDDTYLSETDILKTVAGFLTAAYSQKFNITGLLYLHKITETRVGGTSFRHMNMFKELCGTDSLKNVVYVMNMWSDPPAEDEILRESELRDSDEFFGIPLAEGAQITRHTNTKESAHDVIRMLLPRSPTVPKISKELLDEGLKLEETCAGVALGHGLEEEIQKLNEQIKKLQEDHARAIAENSQIFEEKIKDQERKAQEKHRALEEQLQGLKEGHKQEEAAWAKKLTDHSAAVNASMSKSMSDMMERIGSQNEATIQSILQKHTQELDDVRRAEEERSQRLKQAYDEALATARSQAQPAQSGGICIIV